MNPAENTLREAIRQATTSAARYALAVPSEAGGRSDGRRSGPHSGRSQDFRDYRDYHPGDDLRWVDWAAYARSDRLSVRVFQEEVCPHVDVILDGSRSMALADSRKAEAAAGLTALLAVAAANAGLTVCVWTDGAGLVRLPGTPARPETWPSPAFSGRTNLAAQLRAQPPVLRRRGLRFLVSDLLWPGPPADVLQHLGAGAAALHIMQVLSETDLRPPDSGSLRVADAETGEELDLFLDEAGRQRYFQALATHTAAWDDGCRRYRATLHRLVAEELVRDWTPAELLRQGLLEGA